MHDLAVSTSPRARSVDAHLDMLVNLLAAAERRGAAAGVVPDLLAERVLRAFDAFIHVFDAELRALSAGEARDVGGHVRATLMPWLRRSDNARRWIDKPRGYAGDYLTIAQIYDGVASGDGPVGALIDRCFLGLPAARAVVNRRALVAREIRATQRRCADRTARVASFACGPARELFDVFEAALDPLEATLVDFDDQALTYCATERDLLDVGTSVQLMPANLIHAALGRRTLALAPQDLIYSIGLIDYFEDPLVVKLLDLIHDKLAPGGRVVLGNFHPRNPTKAMLDHVLDWSLIHRTEDDMNRLFRASKFDAGCLRVRYEPLGINLFAEGVKRA